METKIVKRYPLSKQVADKLEEMISKGEYAVGEKIPTEVELMEMFAVSRNTLREAIHSLTSAGVLDVKQGDGTYVRSTDRFNAGMSMKYSQISPEDILEARNCLEITIAGLAAKRRTEDDVCEIKAALDKRNGGNESVKENTLADVEFHKAIARACHNEILIDLYNSVSSYMESHIAERTAATEMEYEEIDALHEKLYCAIRDKHSEIANICAENILKI